MEKINRLIFSFLLTAIVLTTGCATQKPNPLVGWKMLFGHEEEAFDKALKDDYQNYIQKLPS
ncbi:MAG TPA: hypothetical protein VN516_05900, partial [Candidatus Baltobacteraceae bacterium]|nr:hypothetical protein [Candidatus Baltobacteraceae bacterium]